MPDACCPLRPPGMLRECVGQSQLKNRKIKSIPLGERWNVTKLNQKLYDIISQAPGPRTPMHTTDGNEFYAQYLVIPPIQHDRELGYTYVH